MEVKKDGLMEEYDDENLRLLVIFSPSKRGLSAMVLLGNFSYIRDSFGNENFCI